MVPFLEPRHFYELKLLFLDFFYFILERKNPSKLKNKLLNKLEKIFLKLHISALLSFGGLFDDA